jgi:hypothetical protein
MTLRPPQAALPAAASALLLALLAALGPGCGTQTVVAGVLLGTPAVPDPTHPGRSYGPYTILTSVIATVDTSDPTKIQDAKITGLTGVKAQLVYQSCLGLTDPSALASCQKVGTGGQDRVFTVPDKGNGIYELFSGDIATDQTQLTFESLVRYTLILEVPQGTSGDVDAYGASFKPGPRAVMQEFTDKSVVKPVVVGQGFTVHRTDPPVDGQLLPAFVLVGKVDPNNPTAEPQITWNSLGGTSWPPDAKTLVLLALSDQPYRKASFDIAGSAFQSPGYYAVALLSLTEGKASANAFIGSTAIAASGDLGLVQAQ